MRSEDDDIGDAYVRDFVQFSVYTTPDEAKKIREYANKTGRKISWLFLHAVLEYIEQNAE